MNATNLEQLAKHCVFRRGNFYFALPAISMREVVPRPRVIPFPNSSPALAGLCHHRNEFLPVVSLAYLIGDEDSSENVGEEHVLVMCSPQSSWALLIDNVVALTSLEVSTDSSTNDGGFWSQGVMGSAMHREQIVKVLDPHGLYKFVEGTLKSYWDVRGTQPLESRKVHEPSAV